MDAEELKKDLTAYTGYKGTNNKELKIIENSILNSVLSFFRPIVKDVHGIQTISKKLNDNLRKEDILFKLKQMEQVSNNYFINELVVVFMSKAHGDWILAHKEELEKKNMKEPEKFVPFELLTTKELKEYLKVLTPIFKTLNIEFDEHEVKRVFSRRQLTFMIRNEIFSKENLVEKIMNVKLSNPEIIETSSIDGMTIQELYAQEDVVKMIAESVIPRVNLNIEHKFKEVLSQSNDVGFFSTDKGRKQKLIYRFSENISQKKIGFKKQGLPKPEKPITKAVYDLARFGGIILAKNVKLYDYKYFDYSKNHNKFIDYEACTEEQKRAIDRRERKLKKFTQNIDFNGDADTPGVVSMVIVTNDPILSYQDFLDINTEDYKRKTEVIQIPITQRELAKMKVLPEEVGWEKEKKARIQSSDKALFAKSNKLLLERKDFKESLVEIAQNGNGNEDKITMQQIIDVYNANKEKNENER